MTPGLAARQAALVDALVAGAAVPPGFDAERVGATRRALLRKRAGEIAKVWPLLAAGRGDDWADTVRTHLDAHPPVGALRDGWDIARALARRGSLRPAGAGELAEREACWRYDVHTAPRRRRAPAVRTAPGRVYVQVNGRVLRLGRGAS